ncbi:hypothetical protein ACLBUO_29705, partial [Pseudomonas aeruginosa]|uniref:hypothetical protein n=1 Tax=Pseudomonas aeruginosa TaxID=287 RepID=UPI0039694856
RSWSTGNRCRPPPGCAGREFSARVLKTANRQVGAGDLFSLMGHWLQALMIGINNGSPHLAPVSRISAKNASSADKAE